MAVDPEACGPISPHMAMYIKCVQELQHDSQKPRYVHIYGKHFPTRVAATPDFVFVVPAFDASVGNRVVHEGVPMPQEMSLCRHLVPSGGIVIDVSARAGGFTVPIAAHVGESGRVYAFEPLRALFQILSANVAMNGLSNVYTFQARLSNETKTVEERNPDFKTIAHRSQMHSVDNVAAQMAILYGESEDIHVRLLDAYAHRQQRVDLIRIGIEYLALPILQGSARSLAKHRPLVFIEGSEAESTANLHDRADVVAFLSTLQYVCRGFEQSLLLDMTSVLCSPVEQSGILSTLDRFFLGF